MEILEDERKIETPKSKTKKKERENRKKNMKLTKQNGKPIIDKKNKKKKYIFSSSFLFFTSILLSYFFMYLKYEKDGNETKLNIQKEILQRLKNKKEQKKRNTQTI